jgi:Outer membrane protein beta-barrel domain
MRLGGKLSIVSLLAALAPAAAAQDWNKWYAGAGIGAGINATYRQSGNTLDFDEGMPNATDKSSLGAFNVVGGIQWDAKTLVGLSLSGVGKTGKIAGEDARTQINNYFAVFTYFPYERGFFVRGGGGYANMVTDDGLNEVRTGGIGLGVGAGYAWRVIKEHHVTLTIDQSFQFYSSRTDTKPNRSQFSAVYLGYVYRR